MINIKTHEIKEVIQELDITFPYYAAMHRKDTFIKIEAKYYECNPIKGNLECLFVTEVQHGFNRDTFITKQRLTVSFNCADNSLLNIMNRYENIVTKEEYEEFLLKTLELL